MALNEDEKELLADLRESPLWAFLWATIMPAWLEARSTDIANAVREGNIQKAMYETGRRDGALDVAASVYDGPVPEHLKKQRRGI
jgi:hypothetical protein